MELLTERWAPVLGYEGRYEVSDHGQVRSLTRWRRGKSGSLVPVMGRIMRTQVKIAAMRSAGEIVGRYRVQKRESA